MVEFENVHGVYVLDNADAQYSDFTFSDTVEAIQEGRASDLQFNPVTRFYREGETIYSRND